METITRCVECPYRDKEDSTEENFECWLDKKPCIAQRVEVYPDHFMCPRFKDAVAYIYGKGN